MRTPWKTSWFCLRVLRYNFSTKLDALPVRWREVGASAHRLLPREVV
jgi:hypothetical protein